MGKVLTLIFMLLSLPSFDNLYSQDISSPDSIMAGKSYTFVMYDETEISGKVLATGPENIKVLTSSGEVFIIIKSNILYYSTGITLQKYYASVSLLGGVSMLTGRNRYYYNNDMQTGLNINLAGLVYFSDTKALKIDLGYTFVKAKYNNDMYAPLIYPYYPTIYSGGDISYYSLKGNILFGTFKPKNKIMAYGSVGLGFHVSYQNEISEQYYDYNDFTYKTNTIRPQNDINAVISIGGGMAIMLSKQLGIHAEIEYNFVTSEKENFYLYGGKSYFPVRAGIIYMIF